MVDRIGGNARSWPDRVIVVLLQTIAVLLAFQVVFDTDVWWHVRAGQWILAHAQVPRLDPFTFASASRPWIDLHWGFQVALALAHRLGGVPGIVGLAAILCGAAFLTAFQVRLRQWPVAVTGWCWVPALLVMSSRFDPRPEIASLLLMAAFLAVLFRADRSPRWFWLLPVLQVIWVNVHSLFVLGPIIVGCYLADRLARSLLGTLPAPRSLNWWKHAAPACLLLLPACWLNPYGWRGVWFPAELFGKIAAPSNPYKAYVAEFMSLASMVQRQGLATAAANLYLRMATFLLLVLPWSILVPAVWEQAGPETRRRDRFWWALFLGGVTACALGAVGLPARDIPGVLADVGRYSPLGFLLLGVLSIPFVARASRFSPMLLGLGVLAMAGWCDFLRGHLYGTDVAWSKAWGPAVGPVAGILGAIVAMMAIVAGARPFFILLSVAFGMLGLMACRNLNLFGLAAGAVMTLNLGSWADALGAEATRHRAAGTRVATASLIVLLLVWLAAIPTDRFYELSGELRQFGWRERRFGYAHDAARFAGQPGMPDRALVYDIGQTGVYLYHNGPQRKLFMDSRLEVPSLATFREYIGVEQWLQQGDARWVEAVRRMGNPLILVGHEENTDAVATLIAHPRWRCLYFDAVAAVFLHEGSVRQAASFPPVDFFTRFLENAAGPVGDPGAALVQAKHLSEIGSHLSRRPGSRWEDRAPILLLGASHARKAVSALGRSAQAWTILGHCAWGLTTDLSRGPPALDGPWEPAEGLSWVQATACYRKALKESPANLAARLSLARIYEVRGMNDAATASLRAIDNQRADELASFLSQHVAALEAAGRALTWSEAEPRALALLNLGSPVQARTLFERATNPPSPALRTCRRAETYLAEWNLNEAEVAFQRALEQDATQGQAWYGLCLTRLHAGKRVELVDACHHALAGALTTAQRHDVEKFLVLCRVDPDEHPAG